MAGPIRRRISVDTPAPRDDSASAADAATSGDAVCPDAAAAAAADAAEVRETEDPFEREEGASAPIPPPPRNVILSDPLDAVGPADGQDSANTADVHAADAADTAAPTSPGLSDLVDEDLLLLSDDDPEQRAKGK